MVRHDTLLVACGSQRNRDHLRSVLKKRFNLLEASNTRQMLLLLEQNIHCIAAVVLDISNWDVIDESIQSDPEAMALMKQCPVIIIADSESYDDLTIYFHYGAADVIPLNYEPYAMLHRIETITELSLNRKNLEETVASQKENLRNFSDNMVNAVSALVEYRDMDSGHHILRIRNFTYLLLEAVMNHCPEYSLTERTISIIASASALHDVGKIGIPDAILNKPGKLTSSEWEVMKTHTTLGCKMLNNFTSTMDSEYLRYAYNICRYHHERWDGNGYPDNLRGDDIPICAQVVGLTDCYDALTSDRVYKRAYPHAKAVNMILSGKCGVFSPKLLECFKNVTDQFASLGAEYADGRNPQEAVTDMSLPAPTDEDRAANPLDRIRAKYFCLIHYLNAFLMEVQLDTGLFQVVYNPYPLFARVQSATSLRELVDFFARQVVIEEEENRVYDIVNRVLPTFIQEDLRRQSFYFHHRPYGDEPGGAMEMTFLRIASPNKRPSLAILLRKLEKTAIPAVSQSNMQTITTEYTYVCRNDSGFTLVRPGSDTQSFGGYSAQEIMDLFGGRLLDMAFPEDRAAIRREFDRQLRDGFVVRTEYRFPCKDGSIGWVVNKSHLVLGDDGIEYLHSFLFDITDIMADRNRLQEALLRYQRILKQTENILFVLNASDDTFEFSENWEDLFGYTPPKITVHMLKEGQTHIHPDDVSLLLDCLTLLQEDSDFEKVEIRIATDQGRYLWCRVSCSVHRDENGKLIQILGSIANIDAEKQTHLALEDRANRDALTHLLNKTSGKKLIEEYLNNPDKQPKCALLLLDLDNFKAVNDRYGHLFGDTLLTQVSKLLTDLFHRNDIIVRVGGDEFMVLVKDINDRNLIGSHCRRLKDMLVHTFQKEQLDIDMGCSIGIALCPEHGTSYPKLFTNADIALYQVKKEGKNHYCFFSDMSISGYHSDRRDATPIDSDNPVGLLNSNVLYHLFRALYHAEDLDAAIKHVLAVIGKQVNVSRVYVFENSDDDTCCYNTFEWCNEGITPEIQNLQAISYITDIPNYQDNFNEEGVFYCHDVRDLPQSVYEILEPQGINSMLQCAILYGGRFKGYIGFDECSKRRYWTKEEIQVLTFFSEILSTFLLRNRAQKRAQRLQKALEAWSYTVDPKTYTLLDLDDGLVQSSPDLLCGGICYQVLMNRQMPCEGCPLHVLPEEAHDWMLMPNPHGAGKLLVESEWVQWHGQNCRKNTCRRLPEKTP